MLRFGLAANNVIKVLTLKTSRFTYNNVRYKNGKGGEIDFSCKPKNATSNTYPKDDVSHRIPPCSHVPSEEKPNYSACCNAIADNEGHLCCMYDLCGKLFHLICIGKINIDTDEKHSWVCPDCRCALKRGGDNSFTPIGSNRMDPNEILRRKTMQELSRGSFIESSSHHTIAMSALRSGMVTLKELLTKALTLCFDIDKVTIEYGTLCHVSLIRCFLNNHFWPREPSVAGLWMNLDSPYLQILTDKYSMSGDRFLAFERNSRTNEKRLIGLLIASRVCPWMVQELEQWAHYTQGEPERHRMYFTAHCLKSPNFFEKYHVNTIYNVDVLGTTQDVGGHGVGVKLLKHCLDHAQLTREALVQVVSASKYTSTICERCGLKREWTMNYSEFVNEFGQRIFFPRRPHHTVGIYVKYFDPKKGLETPCLPPY